MGNNLETVLTIGAALLIFGLFGTMFIRVVIKAKPKKKVTRKDLYERDLRSMK